MRIGKCFKISSSSFSSVKYGMRSLYMIFPMYSFSLYTWIVVFFALLLLLIAFFHHFGILVDIAYHLVSGSFLASAELYEYFHLSCLLMQGREKCVSLPYVVYFLKNSFNLSELYSPSVSSIISLMVYLSLCGFGRRFST